MSAARLTYRYAPACLADGEMSYSCWYTVYDRAGRIALQTACEDEANQAAAQFPEITWAQAETPADEAMQAQEDAR